VSAKVNSNTFFLAGGPRGQKTKDLRYFTAKPRAEMAVESEIPAGDGHRTNKRKYQSANRGRPIRELKGSRFKERGTFNLKTREAGVSSKTTRIDRESNEKKISACRIPKGTNVKGVKVKERNTLWIEKEFGTGRPKNEGCSKCWSGKGLWSSR